MKEFGRLRFAAPDHFFDRRINAGKTLPPFIALQRLLLIPFANFTVSCTDRKPTRRYISLYSLNIFLHKVTSAYVRMIFTTISRDFAFHSYHRQLPCTHGATTGICMYVCMYVCMYMTLLYDICLYCIHQRKL